METPASSPARKEAAALIPIYRGADGALRIVLIRRSEGGAHGGHLAFPGGKRDPQDASMLDAALREAREEIGIEPAQVGVLAHLPPVDTRTSGFRIYPFLGRIARPAQWRPNEREVAEVIEVPLDALLDPAFHIESAAQVTDAAERLRVPFYRIGGHELWGVTYRILRPLIPRLQNGEWDV